MKEYSACTTILVGKKASIDGTTMIARNDDTFRPITPQKFIIEPARHGEKKHIKSWLNKFEMDLPEDAQRVPAVPNVDYKHRGYYDESGINQENVAMSCTESTYGNERTLAFDPLVKDGLDEDCMQTSVLPYIHSARDGVKYLGKLIAKYGSPAGNSVLFSDKDEIWYMEIVTGHHWVAERIPDDCYAATGNRVAIEQVDFDNPDYFMWSEGIQEFVEKHHLNPDHEGWNFRHIFGTYTEQDRHYNANRQWYIQKLFNPEIEQDPQDGDIPFIRKAAKKITKEDIEFALGSHYQDTPYDPFGKGTDEEKHRYRPISLAKTQEAHILQTSRASKNSIHWIAMGVANESTFVPFFSNINDTPAPYKRGKLPAQLNSAYWIFKHASVLVDSHLHDFLPMLRDVQKDCNAKAIAMIQATDEKAAGLAGAKLTNYLTRQSENFAIDVLNAYRQLSLELITKMTDYCPLNFNTDENL